MADTYFIGHAGNTNAVAAVSLCGPVFAALNAIGGVIGLGGSTTISISTVMFQSAGKALSALILSVSHQGIIFVPVILIMKKAFGYYGAIGAQPVTDILSIMLGMFLFYKTFHNIFFVHNI